MLNSLILSLSILFGVLCWSSSARPFASPARAQAQAVMAGERAKSMENKARVKEIMSGNRAGGMSSMREFSPGAVRSYESYPQDWEQATPSRSTQPSRMRYEYEAAEETEEDDTAYLDVHLPSKQCHVHLSVPATHVSTDGRWQLYRLDSYNYKKKRISLELTMVETTETTRKEETRSYDLDHRNRRSNRFEIDFRWKEPQVTDLAKERREAEYRVALKNWAQWTTEMNTLLKSIEERFAEWVDLQQKEIEHSGYASPLTQQLARLREEVRELLQEERERLEAFCHGYRSRSVELRGFPKGIREKQGEIETALHALESTVLTEKAAAYAKALRVEKSEWAYRKGTLDPWLADAERTVRLWEEEQLSRFTTEPQAELQKLKTSYTEVIQKIEDERLRRRASQKVEALFKEQSKALEALELQNKFQTILAARRSRLTEVYERFLAERRASGSTAEAQREWKKQKELDERKREEEVAQLNSELQGAARQWKELPAPEAIIETERALLERIASLSQLLKEREMQFVRDVVVPTKDAEIELRRWFEAQEGAIGSVPGKLVREELAELLRSEQAKRRNLWASREKLVERERKRREALHLSLESKLLLLLEKQTALAQVQDTFDRALMEDVPREQAFAAGYGATLWPEDFGPIEKLADGIAKKFPWPINIPEACSELRLSLDKEGIIRLEANNEVEVKALLELEAGQLVDMACAGKAWLALVKKVVRSGLKPPERLSGNRAIGTLTSATRKETVALFAQGAQLTAIFGPTFKSSHLVRSWRERELFRILEEAEDGKQYHHAFSDDGSEGDVVEASPVPERDPALFTRDRSWQGLP